MRAWSLLQGADAGLRLADVQTRAGAAILVKQKEHDSQRDPN